MNEIYLSPQSIACIILPLDAAMGFDLDLGIQILVILNLIQPRHVYLIKSS